MNRDGIWSAADVYTVRLPLPGDSMPLVHGLVMARAGEYSEDDALYGMRPTDDQPVAEKNDPPMPIVWTKTYQLPGGSPGRVFSTTLGSSTDLLEDGVRQMLVNAVFWALRRRTASPRVGQSPISWANSIPLGSTTTRRSTGSGGLRSRRTSVRTRIAAEHDEGAVTAGVTGPTHGPSWRGPCRERDRTHLRKGEPTCLAHLRYPLTEPPGRGRIAASRPRPVGT